MRQGQGERVPVTTGKARVPSFPFLSSDGTGGVPEPYGWSHSRSTRIGVHSFDAVSILISVSDFSERSISLFAPNSAKI